MKENIKKKLKAILDKYREQQEWGGDEDENGSLHPGTIDFDELETELINLMTEEESTPQQEHNNMSISKDGVSTDMSSNSQYIKDTYIRWKDSHLSCWEVVNFLCDLIGDKEAKELEPNVLPTSKDIEHKSIEELEEYPQPELTMKNLLEYLDTLEMTQPEEFKTDNWRNWKYIRNNLRNYFGDTPHLNSRNLLERFAIFVDAKTTSGTEDKLNIEWLDEFIESEK